MARAVNRLSARKVETETRVGRHADGAGLYLSISPNGGRRWVFLYRRGGRLRELGLGSAREVSLALARKKALAHRAELAAGSDPLSVKRRKAGLTFQECAEQYIAAHKAGWKNSKHSAQWASTLSTYAYPKIGLEPVNEIDTAAVMRCLQPIWADKNETAARLRGRIEAILDWARVSEYRSGENPARWRGHLQKLLAKRAAVSKVRHHPAMPYSEVPEFFRRLAMQNGIAARSLSFLILTATRTSEVTGARWREIDLKERLWIIPAERMKMGKEHRVPLSASCAAVLDAMKQLGEESDGLIFPGAKPGIPQSENTMLALLRRMDCAHVTVHGFRSSFRDWAAETTPYANEVLEKALAHGIKDKAEAAYRRGHLFDKRVSLMKDWADFCEGRTLAK